MCSTSDPSSMKIETAIIVKIYNPTSIKFNVADGVEHSRSGNEYVVAEAT